MLCIKKLTTGFLVLQFVFYVLLSGLAVAEGCKDCDSGQGVSTISGNHVVPEGWVSECECEGYSPNVYTSSETVTRNNHVDVWVDSGGLACPPYSWSASGTGFHFNSSTGPTTEETQGDLIELQLWADGMACGSAIITVTDTCGKSATASVRDPNHGLWVLVEEISCGTLDPDPDGCDCTSVFECIQGGYKYQDAYIGGNRMYRWHPSGNCSKYSCTPYDRNYCYCVGYYPKKYHVGMRWKKKYIWGCPP